MKLQRVLFPVDFSKHNRAALDFAASLARDAGARLVLVHVKETPVEVSAGGGLAVAELGPDLATVKAELNDIAPSDPAVPCERHVLIGSPAAEIVRFAKQDKCDLIVMSTHGRTGLLHLLMGSVAERVVRRAPCPVMTIRTSKPAD
jgi:nucleotide-binding universal stress UspA family protein